MSEDKEDVEFMKVQSNSPLRFHHFPVMITSCNFLKTSFVDS